MVQVHRDDDTVHAGIIVETGVGAVGIGRCHFAVKHILYHVGALGHNQRVAAGIQAGIGAHHAVHVHQRGRGGGSAGTILLKQHHHRCCCQVGVDIAAGGKRVVFAHVGVAELGRSHLLAVAVNDIIGVAIHGNQALAVDVDEVVVLERYERLVVLVHHTGLFALEDDVVATGRAREIVIAAFLHLLLVVDGVGNLLALGVQAHQGVTFHHGEHAVDVVGLDGLVGRRAGVVHHLAALVDDGEGHRAVIRLAIADDHGIVVIEEQVGAVVGGGNDGVATGVDIAPLAVVGLDGGHATGKHRAL